MDLRGDELAGTCAFRMMPADPLLDGPSSAVVTTVGPGLSVHYTWQHPADGEQRGAVLVGAVAEDGTVEVAWFDTWHQQPGLMRLEGSRSGPRVEVAGTYAEEWGWEILLQVEPGRASMVMRNVVPQSAIAAQPTDGPPVSAGPYDVMVAFWGAGDAGSS